MGVVLGTAFALTLPVEKLDLPAPEPAAEETAEPETISFGDVNKDGVLDTLDVNALQNIYLKGETSLTEEELYTIADINGDGIIDTNDTAILMSYLANADSSTQSLKAYAESYSG